VGPVERLDRLNLGGWGGWGSRVGFLSFLWAYLSPIGKKKGGSVDGHGSSDRSIHIGGWNLMVGAKKAFPFVFPIFGRLYLGKPEHE